MWYCTLLNSDAPLTFFDHNLKINGRSGRERVKTTETKSPLGMLEWLQPLGALQKVEVIDCSKLFLKTKCLSCQVTRRGRDVLGEMCLNSLLRQEWGKGREWRVESRRQGVKRRWASLCDGCDGLIISSLHKIHHYFLGSPQTLGALALDSVCHS